VPSPQKIFENFIQKSCISVAKFSVVLRCIYAIYRLIKQRGQTSDKMLKNAIAYAEICAIYANFSICGVFSAYAILKMPLYAEKYAICTFCQNMRSHMRSRIRI